MVKCLVYDGVLYGCPDGHHHMIRAMGNARQMLSTTFYCFYSIFSNKQATFLVLRTLSHTFGT